MIYVYNSALEQFEVSQSIVTGSANAISTIAMGDDVFLAVANAQNSLTGGNSTVYIYDHVEEEFDELQSITIGGKGLIRNV